MGPGWTWTCDDAFGEQNVEDAGRAQTLRADQSRAVSPCLASRLSFVIFISTHQNLNARPLVAHAVEIRRRSRVPERPRPLPVDVSSWPLTPRDEK